MFSVVWSREAEQTLTIAKEVLCVLAACIEPPRLKPRRCCGLNRSIAVAARAQQQQQPAAPLEPSLCRREALLSAGLTALLVPLQAAQAQGTAEEFLLLQELVTSVLFDCLFLLTEPTTSSD